MATSVATPGSKSNPHIKDPNAILDYYEDWSDFLIPVADTIESVELIFSDPDTTLEPDPAHPSTPTTDGLIVAVWLQGGRPKKNEECTVRIHTVNLRTDDRTMHFKMMDK